MTNEQNAPLDLVVKFLLGECALNGRWFGDEDNLPLVAGKYPARYWWRSYLRDAIAAPAAPPSVTDADWQSMDSAPRDGTVIRLRWGEDGDTIGWWMKRKRFDNLRCYPWAFVDTQTGRAFVNNAVDGEYGPTQWAALTHPGHKHAQEDAAQEGPEKSEALHSMNADLCDFSMRWRLDGDYFRCKSCNRPHIASATEIPFLHADGCKAAPEAETHPWVTFVRMLRPLSPIDSEAK